MTVQLQVKSVDTNNNSKTSNIGYINPNATDAILNQFATKLFTLSNNNITEINKVTTTDITNVNGEG